MVVNKLKYCKIFIISFLCSLFMIFISGKTISAMTRGSEDQRHSTHYVISSSGRWATNKFTLQYNQNGSTNWTTPIKTGMSQWNDEGANIKLGASTYKIESMAFGTASWAGSTQSNRISLNDSAVTNNTQRAEVVAHELGHALGLGHVSCQDELMRAIGLKGSPSLYAGDITGYHKIW